jgi:ATP-dependent DNA helicase RecG
MPIRAAHDVRAARDESLDIHPDTLERFYRINKSFETRRLFMRYPGCESLAFPVLAYDSDTPNSLFILEKHAFIEVRDGKRKFKKWDALLKEIRAGFYPEVAMVRESLFRAGMDMDDATGYWERMFPDQVTIIHGRLKEKDKQAALDAFTAGDKPLIVATSIVEVGIDVKGVDCLVLANADRFGTASLVQLRGRVGRSGDYGICLLISPSDDGSDFARLQAFAEETDDMRLAEMDFKERGWGQINGALQTGVPSTFFNLKKHAAIIEKISEKINS